MTRRLVKTVRHWFGLHDWVRVQPPHVTVHGLVISFRWWCTWCGRYR